MIELEEFAEVVRRQCHDIMCAGLNGNGDRAAEMAAALCTQAAGIVQGAKMEREVSAPDRYDLAALHVQADVASNSETPFEEE